MNLSSPVSGRVPKLAMRLARMCFLAIVTGVMVIMTEHPDQLFNPVLGIAGGCLFGLMVDGVYNESGRTWQVILIDATIGFMIWGSLQVWLYLETILPEAVVPLLNNPGAVIILVIIFSRLTILIEDAEHAHAEGVEEGQSRVAEVMDRVQYLEDRLDAGGIGTSRMTAPSDEDGHGSNGDGRRARG